MHREDVAFGKAGLDKNRRLVQQPRFRALEQKALRPEPRHGGDRRIGLRQYERRRADAWSTGVRRAAPETAMASSPNRNARAWMRELFLRIPATIRYARIRTTG